MIVVIARDGDTLLGIMPLLLERRRWGIWPQTVLHSMTNLQTYKYNFILHNESAATVLAAMFRRLRQELPWAMIELDFVPTPTCILSLLEAMQGKDFYRVRSEFHMDSPYLAIGGSWEAYLHGRDKKVKKNWDYFERKLDKEGNAEVISVDGGKDLPQQIDKALSIERSSWKGDNGTAISNSPVESAFYHALADVMSAQGKFKLYFLELNGRKIAFDYCLTHNDRFNVLKTGYDPEYSKLSPGRVLRKILLRNLYDDGQYKVYDLLGAREAWKTEWSDTSQTLLHIYIYNRRPAAILDYNIAQFIEWFKTRLRHYPRAFQAFKAVYRRLRR